MAEGNTWPEQDAINVWWEKHRFELATVATKYRLEVQPSSDDEAPSDKPDKRARQLRDANQTIVKMKAELAEAKEQLAEARAVDVNDEYMVAQQGALDDVEAKIKLSNITTGLLKSELEQTKEQLAEAKNQQKLYIHDAAKRIGVLEKRLFVLAELNGKKAEIVAELAQVKSELSQLKTDAKAREVKLLALLKRLTASIDPECIRLEHGHDLDVVVAEAVQAIDEAKAALEE